MSIQWFPGHMNAARKEAAKTMEVIDVIVEVLDARIPGASCNPLIEELRLARQRVEDGKSGPLDHRRRQRLERGGQPELQQILDRVHAGSFCPIAWNTCSM